MTIISVANSKGGVGKSTIAVNLAICAIKDGKKVLLIDADVQGSSTSFRAIREADDLQAVSIIQPTIHKDIESFSNFDLIFIDAGGRDNALFRSAITAASKGLLLIPVLPSQYDIWATEDTFKMLKEIRVYVPIKACAVFNQVIQNTKISQEAKEALEELTVEGDVTLLKTVLYNRIDYKKSISDGLGVVEYQPKGKAAAEITALYNEIKKVLFI
jgi:chromosome partitioning protein